MFYGIFSLFVWHLSEDQIVQPGVSLKGGHFICEVDIGSPREIVFLFDVFNISFNVS